ncbi:DVUA0089 family protein [Candidatus Sumerlaeota bacterium]
MKPRSRWLILPLILCFSSMLLTSSAQDDHEPDDVYTSAKELSPGVPHAGHSINPIGDVDWVTFALAEDSDIVLETSGVSGDTILYLYASDGVALLDSDDDGGTGLFSSIAVSLTAGTYCAKVEEFRNDALIPDYVILLAVSVVLPDAYESDDVFTSASVLAADTTQTSHSISPVGDVDWVTFTLDQNSQIVLETSGPSGDTRMWLYKSIGGTEVASDDSSGVSAFSRIDIALAAGVYNVKIEEDGNNSQIPIYSISLAVSPGVVGDAYEQDDQASSATIVTSGSLQTGHSIHPIGESDWITFTLAEDALVFLETSGPSGNTEMHLFGSDGITEIASDSSSGSGDFSLIATHLRAGVYYARISAYFFGDTISDYAISLTVLTMPFPGTKADGLVRYGLGSIMCADYSPNADRPRIATGGPAGIVIWNTATGEVIRVLSALGHEVRCIAFSPDGSRILTGGTDQTARLWDVDTGMEVRVFRGHLENVNSVAFSADGSRIVTGCGTISWSGKYQDTTAKLWETETGELLQSFVGHLDPVWSVAISSAGTKVLTGSWASAKLWDAETGLEILSLPGLTDDVHSVAFSLDGTQLLTGSGWLSGGDNVARLWDATSGTLIQSYSGHASAVGSVAISKDGTRILTGSWDGTAKLWDAGAGTEIRSYSGHSSYLVDRVVFSPGELLILTAGVRKANLWETDTGSLVRTFEGHSEEVDSVAFLPGAQNVLIGADQDATLWDFPTGQEIRTVSVQPAYIRSVAVSPDGARILTGDSDGFAKVWSVATGLGIVTMNAPWGIYSVVFSPDGTKALTSGSGTRLWDIATGTELQSFPSGSACATFSSQGTMVLTDSGDQAVLYNVATGSKMRPFIGHSDTVTAVALSPDDALVLTGSWDKTAKIWNAATGLEIRTLWGHTGILNCVAFSPDGEMALTGSGDGKAKLWDVETGHEIMSFLSHTAGVASVAFSADGTRVLTGGDDGQTFVWELNPPRAIIVAGGGDYSGNGIADQTNDLGPYAYLTLKRRGYEPADIMYLTAFATAPDGSLPQGEEAPFRDADGDGLNDVDGWATLENLERAITGAYVPGADPSIPAGFGSGAGRLMILMMDHGHRTQNFMTFRVNEEQLLPSTKLDGWLDDLQTSHATDVALVVDCCHSGAIVDDCRLTATELTGGAGWRGSAGHDPAALEGRKRILIASTAAERLANFTLRDTTFMYQFLSSAYMGNSMGTAWRAGNDFFKEYNVAGQIPRIHDGSDLTTDTTMASTPIANKHFFGASWAYGVQSTLDVNDFFPVFDRWMPNTLSSPGEPLTLWVELLSGQTPLDIVAVVRPPAPEVISGEPVTNLPYVYLEQNPTTPSRWEALTTDTFVTTGSYVVSFSARFAYERVSKPVIARITVAEGLTTDTTPIHAILAVGDTDDPALASSFAGIGPYAYSVYLDRFQNERGESNHGWIDYLIDPAIDSQSDGPASVETILAAIDGLPPDIGRLYVHLIDDGELTQELLLSPNIVAIVDHLLGRADLSRADEELADANGDGVIDVADIVALVNAGGTPLDAALDALQARQDCQVILMVDAPGSGEFLAACHATGAQQRAILSSGRSSDPALFLPSPTLTSFSRQFLSAAYQGRVRRGQHFLQVLSALLRPSAHLPAARRQRGRRLQSGRWRLGPQALSRAAVRLRQRRRRPAVRPVGNHHADRVGRRARQLQRHADRRHRSDQRLRATRAERRHRLACDHHFHARGRTDARRG